MTNVEQLEARRLMAAGGLDQSFGGGDGSHAAAVAFAGACAVGSLLGAVAAATRSLKLARRCTIASVLCVAPGFGAMVILNTLDGAGPRYAAGGSIAGLVFTFLAAGLPSSWFAYGRAQS